ncbi:MAG: DUF4838 domain-containing protein [Chitinophagaceae bacterium]|nr:DUF4838 domain-containing protein [Chitinophagaceae bacterium]
MSTTRKDFIRLAGMGFAGIVLPKKDLSVSVTAGQGIEGAGKKLSTYRIILNGNASESEKWAAAELQHWLFEISREYIPVYNQDASYQGSKIVLGYNEDIKNRTGLPEPAFDDESYHYFTADGNVYIYGGRQRGTMYGVFSFLENEFGCRWYTPQVSLIPEKPVLLFNQCDHKEKPGVQVRNNFYFEAFDATWAARNKMNGRMFLWNPKYKPNDGIFYKEQPGGEETYWSVHTFFPLMPPEEFYDRHPEYYSLINGKRIYERAQLCLSNKDVLKIITQRIKENIRKYPKFLIYDVSQNDWRNPCQCDKCQAIVKREGGQESGIMIWFVNQVAEAIEKEFPDKYIGTLAYQYTRTPPKNIRPRHNVVVRLCPIEACVAHPLNKCPENKSFMDDLETWASISPHLYIWDYVVNFARYIMPYPNFYVLQSNIKTFRDNKAIGIMEQANHQSRGGEFEELKCYVLAKLLWNPECDMEEAVNDFIYSYYGRAGRYIREYFDLVHSLVKPDTHMHIRFDATDKMFTDDFVNRSLAVFENARRVADNKEVLARVELTWASILYLKCRRQPVLSRNDGTYRKLISIVEKEGVTHFAEYRETKESFMQFIESAN